MVSQLHENKVVMGNVSVFSNKCLSPIFLLYNNEGKNGINIAMRNVPFCGRRSTGLRGWVLLVLVLLTSSHFASVCSPLSIKVFGFLDWQIGFFSSTVDCQRLLGALCSELSRQALGL